MHEEPSTPRRLTRRGLLTGVGGSLLVVNGAQPSYAGARTDRSHPFLLVTPEEFDELRERASGEPWASWKNSALAKAAEPYDPTQSLGTRVRQMAELAGCASTAYVVDPGNADARVERILSLIDSYDADIAPALDSDSWDATTGAASGFFHLVIGLDLIYPELSPDERADSEAKLGKVGDWYYVNRVGSWVTGRIGAYGVWAVYAGDSDRITESIATLRAEHDAATSADGVPLAGPSYAGHRFASRFDRDSKSYFIDVVTKAGYYDFYEDPDYINRIEFVTGYISTPVTRTTADGAVRDQFTFGDSPATRNPMFRSARTYSASRFGDVAARNAGWSLNRVSFEPLGMLTFYALTDRALLTDATVPSRIFYDAGAWFYERSTSANALAGALWNVTKAGEHQHDDTNALHLTAYGEHVLRNSGYRGFGNGAVGFSWTTLRSRAVVNNTVLLDYDRHFADDFAPPGTNDHQQAYGAGIAEGFTGGLLDYASGGSGNALPNGMHTRNFCFVHPRDGAPGYWVLFDEVAANRGRVPASVALHPNSDTDPQVVADDTEYTYTVNPHRRTTNDVKLSIFLATPPASVSFKPGPIADRQETFRGRYLYSSYDTDPAGAARIVTVLFPHDNGHPKPAMSRVGGQLYAGAAIRHEAGAVDYALESDGATLVRHDGTQLRGLAALYRKSADGLHFYFVRRGRRFSYGDKGFRASRPVSVYLAGSEGNIVNENSRRLAVTFYHPGVTGVTLDGDDAQLIDSDIGWVRVRVPAGTFRLELVT